MTVRLSFHAFKGNYQFSTSERGYSGKFLAGYVKVVVKDGGYGIDKREVE